MQNKEQNKVASPQAKVTQLNQNVEAILFDQTRTFNNKLTLLLSLYIYLYNKRNTVSNITSGVTLPVMVRDLRVGNNTLSSAIEELESLGLIQRVNGKFTNNKRFTNSYYFPLDAYSSHAPKKFNKETDLPHNDLQIDEQTQKQLDDLAIDDLDLELDDMAIFG